MPIFKDATIIVGEQVAVSNSSITQPSHQPPTPTKNVWYAVMVQHVLEIMSQVPIIYIESNDWHKCGSDCLEVPL